MFERDRYHCRLTGWELAGSCVGVNTFHHIKKASAGGGWSLLGGVTLCSRHNGWVEDFPLAAHHLGLVCRNGDTLAECWERMAAAGLVDYGPDGAPLALRHPITYSALDTSR